MKRMESSVYAFRHTLVRIKDYMYNTTPQNITMHIQNMIKQ